MKRMHDDKELIKLLQDEGFLDEVKVENIDSDNATQGEVLMADGSGGAEWSEVEAGMENPMTAKDDIIIGGASGAPARLAKGTNGQVLAVGADGLEWTTPSGGGADNILEIDGTSSTTVYDKIVSEWTNIVNRKYDFIRVINNSTYKNIYLISWQYSPSGSSPNGYLYLDGTKSGQSSSGVETVWFGTRTIYSYVRLNCANGIFDTWGDTKYVSYNIQQEQFNSLFIQKDAPSTDGTYVLKCTVSSGVKTYTWVAE